MKNNTFSVWIAIFLFGMICGTCVGFSASGLPVIGRRMGWSLDMIGLLALPFLPMGIVFLWAPMLDKYILWGRDVRRCGIVTGLTGIPGGTLLASQSENNFGGLCLALLLSVSVATLSLSFNALLIERLTDDQLPYGKSLQMGGYLFGETAGGGLLLIVYLYLGWEKAFILVMLIACIGFPLLPLLPCPESSSVLQRPVLQRQARLRHFFQHIMAWQRLRWVFMLCLSCGIGNSMLRPFMIDYGFSVEEVGVIMGGVASVAGALGAMVAGKILSIWNLRKVMTGILLLMVLNGCLLWIVIVAGVLHFGIVAVLAITGSVLSSAFFVTLSVQTMRWAGGTQPGTDFSLFESMAFVSGIIGSGIAGILAKYLGFSSFFMLWAVLVMLALLVAMPLHRRILLSDITR